MDDIVILENKSTLLTEMDYKPPPIYNSSTGSTDENPENENESENENNNEVFKENDGYSCYFRSFDDIYIGLLGFVFGLLSYYGTINLLGFLIGLHHKYFIDKTNLKIISKKFKHFLPAFMLGMILMHLNIFYFIISSVIGVMSSKYSEDFIKKYLRDLTFENKYIDINMLRNNFGTNLLGIIYNRKNNKDKNH